MQTVLPREEAVEAVISKVLGSQEACDRLNEVFYEHLENYQEINDDGDRHFAEVLLQAYKNGDVSALLLELCGGGYRLPFQMWPPSYQAQLLPAFVVEQTQAKSVKLSKC